MEELENIYSEFQQDLEIHVDFKKVIKANIDGNKDVIPIGEVAIKSQQGRDGLELDSEYEYIQLKQKGIFDPI